jgi:hypothetical protein
MSPRPANPGAPADSRRRAVVTLLALGAVTAGLYLLLFLFADPLIQLAVQTREGNKLYALVPIAIALVFSFVHGAFTSRFWDLLGLKAKK